MFAIHQGAKTQGEVAGLISEGKMSSVKISRNIRPQSCVAREYLRILDRL